MFEAKSRSRFKYWKLASYHLAPEWIDHGKLKIACYHHRIRRGSAAFLAVVRSDFPQVSLDAAAKSDRRNRSVQGCREEITAGGTMVLDAETGHRGSATFEKLSKRSQSNVG